MPVEVIFTTKSYLNIRHRNKNLETGMNVLVLAEDFTYQEERYNSLTKILLYP